MKGFTLCFTLFSFAFINLSYAQNYDTDTKLRTAVVYEHSISKKWNLGLEQHLRFKDNVKSIDNFFTELNAEFSTDKRWKFDVELRYIFDRDNKGKVRGYDELFRYRFGIQKGFKLGRNRLKLKASHQTKREIGSNNLARFMRFRPTIDLNFRDWKWDPALYVEYFHPLDNGLDRSVRYGIRTKGKMIGTSAIALRYFLDQRLRSKGSQFYHVFSIRFGFSNK